MGQTITGALANIPFPFGIDSEGNYGYKKAGADTVTPFSSRIDFSTMYTATLTVPAASTATLTLPNVDVCKFMYAVTYMAGTFYVTTIYIDGVCKAGYTRYPITGDGWGYGDNIGNYIHSSYMLKFTSPNTVFAERFSTNSNTVFFLLYN